MIRQEREPQEETQEEHLDKICRELCRGYTTEALEEIAKELGGAIEEFAEETGREKEGYLTMMGRVYKRAAEDELAKRREQGEK